MTCRKIYTGTGELSETLNGNIRYSPKDPYDYSNIIVSDSVESKLLFEILLILSRRIPGESTL